MGKLVLRKPWNRKSFGIHRVDKVARGEHWQRLLLEQFSMIFESG